MTSNSISTEERTGGETSSMSGKKTTTEIPKNKEMIDQFFEDSKNILKNEYDNIVVKLKEDLDKSKERAISKLKKL
ncbi:MAG TPA: hypothetical protein VFK40_02390 [Nitrososphaeraceae archaeon]|nr:hypothetical protein [Nitrososphaeraceae archaeon]